MYGVFIIQKSRPVLVATKPTLDAARDYVTKRQGKFCIYKTGSGLVR
jgi:hypothetical protein